MVGLIDHSLRDHGADERADSLTCRQRKLKCGEQKPKCTQCTKAGRDCSYGEGIVFRHQQNASMNGEGPSGAGGGLTSFYSYKNTFGPDSVWVDIPEHGSFLLSLSDANETHFP